MSSILTNNSAMMALESLRMINTDLNTTQNQISTGKKVASSSDNASVWAITNIMDSDIGGFKQISDSLSLGKAAVENANNAVESVSDVLKEMKALIVSANSEGVDKSVIQSEIDKQVAQIETIVDSAQTNGLNLIDGTVSDDFDILSSLNRKTSGATTTVTADYINVARQDISVSTTGSAAVYGTTIGAVGTSTAAGDAKDAIFSNGATGTAYDDAVSTAAGATEVLTVASVADGHSYSITLDDTAGDNGLGTRTFQYVASSEDSVESVASNLANQMTNYFGAVGESGYTATVDGDEITITNSATSGGALAVSIDADTGGNAGVDAGGLGNLNAIDVTTEAGATAALSTIEDLIQRTTDAGAAFGASIKQIDIQSEFVTSLVDNLTSGMGALRDTDMETASAKLQALQVQQQLGVQALSIANRSPQTLLSLFQ